MNLLYTLTSYPPAIGGAQSHQHEIARRLRSRHSIRVLTQWSANRADWLLGTTLRAPDTSEAYQVDGVDVTRIGVPQDAKGRLLPCVLAYYPLMRWAAPAAARVVEELLDQEAGPADLVHNVRIGREVLSYASMLLARRRRVPFVLTPVHHPRWSSARYRVFHEIYRAADRLIALTNAERRMLVQLGVEADRIDVTGMGPVLAQQSDPSGFLRSQGIEGPLVLFVGQHYPYKGYRQVLQAAPRVWRQIPAAEFAFVGPPVGRSRRHLARLRDPRIHVLGAVDLQTKTDAIAACSLLCVPSTQESFGAVYVEAWTYAKPVIGSPIPALREVVADGVDGLLVEQRPDAVADAILDLLLHPQKASAMGQAGNRKVVSQYTWEEIADRTEDSYQKAWRA